MAGAIKCLLNLGSKKWTKWTRKEFEFPNTPVAERREGRGSTINNSRGKRKEGHSCTEQD